MSEGRLVAFYYPQFHPCPVNNAHYGEGFTEWDMVKSARPLYAGHSQPRIPSTLGYYDLLQGDVYPAQVELAELAGLSGFCFYHYWFSGGRRLLGEPFSKMLSSSISWPFCVMWANHAWNLAWKGRPSEVSVDMAYGPDDASRLMDSLLPALRDTRYIRVEDKPLILIYDLDDIPNQDSFVGQMRTRAEASGIGEIHISVAMRGMKWVRSNAIDSVFEFPPHGYSGEDVSAEVAPEGLISSFQGRLFDYRRLVGASLAKSRLRPGHRVFRTVLPGWDNTGRRMTNCDASVYLGSDPDLFGVWTEALLADIEAQADIDTMPIVFINAWNEWGEGAYLEPDCQLESRRLESVALATKKARGLTAELVLARMPEIRPSVYRVWHGLFISHDPSETEPNELPGERREIQLVPEFPALATKVEAVGWTTCLRSADGTVDFEPISHDELGRPLARIVLASSDHSYATVVPWQTEGSSSMSQIRITAALDFRLVEPGEYAATVETGKSKSREAQLVVACGDVEA